MKKLFLSIALFSALSFSLNSNAQGSVGAGVGPTYGFVGGSTDFGFSDNMYGTLGLGTTGEEMTYNLGFRVYLKDRTHTWQPRVTLQYGTTGVIQTDVCFWACETQEHFVFESVSIGIGQSIMFGSSKKHGIDVDLFFKLDDGGMDEKIEELEGQGYVLDKDGNDILLSIGYRYNF